MNHAHPELTPKSRTRRRRGKRGAALVEAAACLPLFVVLWFSILYAHNLFATKLSINAGSRAIAWGYAMGNCGSSASPNPTPTPSLNGNRVYPNMSMPPIGAIMGQGGFSGWLSGIAGVISNIFSTIVPLAQDYNSQWTMNQSVSYNIPDLYDGTVAAGANPVTSMVTVTCNEAPQNGDLKGFLKTIWNAVRPW